MSRNSSGKTGRRKQSFPSKATAPASMIGGIVGLDSESDITEADLPDHSWKRLYANDQVTLTIDFSAKLGSINLNT